jgi:hypothetical protein
MNSLKVFIISQFTLLTVLAGAHAGESERVTADEHRVLLLDPRVVESADNAHLQVAEPLKEARNPLLVPDKPWENATNNFYPNVAWDPSEKLWKLWYKDVLADEDAAAKMENPSKIHGVGWYLLYATSKDGLNWERPELGLHSFNGTKQNNITARDCPNAGVFFDAQDPDASRRYKMVFDVGLGKPRTRFSADGVHWGEPNEPQGFLPTQGDTHNNAFFDPRSKKYLWFTKMYLGERLVSRLESDDFSTWRSKGVVLRSSIEEGRAHQTYAMTVFPYANGYMGFLMMYHVGAGRTVDCELAWSPDALHWQRVAPGKPFLRNGTSGSYDGGCIYVQAGPAVKRDGRLQIYYGGSPTPHFGWKRSGSLCLATIPEDGFAGYEVLDPALTGIVLTAPLRLTDHKAEARYEGEVKMQTEPLENGLVQLRFTLSPGAKLYSISGVKLADESIKKSTTDVFKPSPVQSGPVRVDFKEGTQGWKGTDAMEHVAADGCVRVRRSGKGLQPIAFGKPFPGDWTSELGGKGVTFSARVRTPIGGSSVRFELFADDLGQWWFETRQATGTEWRTFSTELDYGWTDAEAEAAGWKRADQAFGWRDTLRHAGKMVVMTSGGVVVESFDMAEVLIEPR